MTTVDKPRGATGRQFHSLRVAKVERLCDDAVAVTFDVPAELRTTYDFRPGQSLTLRRVVDGVDERRSYSICAPAGAAPRIGVREVPGGLFSSWLVRDVRPGLEIEVGPPTGNFTPEIVEPARHVLIAAGSGVTPMMSIAPSVLSQPGSTVALLYGNRRTDTVMFADDWADLKDSHPARLELTHVLSREPREAELFSGRLDADRLRALLPRLFDVDSVDHWWLCGPYGMITDAVAVLRELSVPSERVHRELFFVDEPPEPVRHVDAVPAGPTHAVTVRLDGRATTVAVRPTERILDAAQRVRADLPFACRGGVCGTCRARVVEGEVDMRRNFALEDAEVDAGFVLTCQSFPKSDIITVDYDT